MTNNILVCENLHGLFLMRRSSPAGPDLGCGGYEVHTLTTRPPDALMGLISARLRVQAETGDLLQVKKFSSVLEMISQEKHGLF